MSYKFLPVIIFGDKDLAELAHFYLQNDSEYTVVGFTLNKEFIKEDRFNGGKVVAFEELEKHFPPADYLLFAPIADNILRTKIYNEGKEKGYRFISYISSECTNFAKSIGENCLF